MEYTTLQQEITSLTSELAGRYEELNLLYRVGDKLKISKDIRESLKDIIKEASYVLHGNSIILYIPGNEIFEYYSNGVKYPDNGLYDMANKMMEMWSSARTYIGANSLDEFKSYGFKSKDWFKFIGITIKVKDEPKGILAALGNSQGKDYTTGDIKLLTLLAEQISIMITNNELYQNLRDLVLNFVKSMISVIEAKDSYTRGHSERVHKISVMIAKSMGLSFRDLENLTWASILHDIGKIGVPEKILTKPNRLTDREYALVKTHPGKGYVILKPIEQIKDALPGILYHQERFDGTGYPEGLKGEQIPLYARVIAVADTYDAITSSRAYRPRNSHLEAMKEIERISGTQLDPEIVEAFKKVCNSHPDFIIEE